ncbi:hypothetical protein FRC20_009879 [Serendipita sp. 405]|nr:hypothetical protein FRC15_002401 [Serendipita sp. 397]KAG8865093.1 hypothetical protein FRC20_009879 [Serendipita sp. 405]
MREMTTDMTKARQALGPWFKPTSLSPPSSSQAPERVTGRRRLSSPLTSGMLAFPDTSRDPSGPSERGITNSANASNSVNPASPTLLPVDSGLAPTITLQDFTPRTQAHSPIPPINMETTLEGSLGSLRHSIVTLSTEFESLSRRQDMHYTTELLRLHEEVASLRATVHGLRMQVHTFMTSSILSGGIGYTQYGAGDSATVQYVNQSPPPSTVISIATHRRVAENKL